MRVGVKVVSGAKKEAVEEVNGTWLKVSVKEKPKHGAANARVIKLVAKHLKVPVKVVRIVRGHRTPSKILEVATR